MSFCRFAVIRFAVSLFRRFHCAFLHSSAILKPSGVLPEVPHLLFVQSLSLYPSFASLCRPFAYFYPFAVSQFCRLAVPPFCCFAVFIRLLVFAVWEIWVVPWTCGVWCLFQWFVALNFVCVAVSPFRSFIVSGFVVSLFRRSAVFPVSPLFFPATSAWLCYSQNMDVPSRCEICICFSLWS